MKKTPYQDDLTYIKKELNRIKIKREKLLYLENKKILIQYWEIVYGK